MNALNILSRASVLSEEEKRRRTPIMLFTTDCTCFTCVSQLRLSVSVTLRILIAFDCMMLALPSRSNNEKDCLHSAILEDNQWRYSALIIGGRHSGRCRQFFFGGGIQATISHPSKFGGGTIPPCPPPLGNCAYGDNIIEKHLAVLMESLLSIDHETQNI